MTETWRAIPDYRDYEVSSEGRIRRITSRTSTKAGRVLSVRGLRAGYPSVDLVLDGKRATHLVHRIVAVVFLGPCPVGCEVNHRDGNKTNNSAANLEYVTRASNQLHAYRTGLQDASGEKNGFAKLTREDVAKIRQLAAEPNRPSYPQIGRMFGVTESNVRAIVQGRSWKEA